MSTPLSGQTAIVSGSTAGIGYAIAEELARNGAAVVVSGRTQARVDAAVAALSKAVPGASLRGVAADLSTAEGAAALIAQVPQADILINNVGIFERKPFDQTPDEDWQRFFDVNVMSGVRLSRAYLPGMKQRNWGRIVFISSESGIQIPHDMVHYAVESVLTHRGFLGLVGDGQGAGFTTTGGDSEEAIERLVESFQAEM